LHPEKKEKMSKKEIIQAKIFNFNSEGVQKLQRLVAFWKFKDYKITFTNGCFDIVHPGHIDYLSRSADLGDKLIIGLNSDSSVQKIKGNNRPYLDEQSRAILLASLGFVDAVVIFSEDTPYELIKTVAPDILVKGGDYQAEKIIGADLMTARGCRVEILDFVEGYSTSMLIEKIRKQ
jgi:D-glycero-beta-D-manno-heptose 1-phosphate adenylyltransferase